MLTRDLSAALATVNICDEVISPPSEAKKLPCAPWPWKETTNSPCAPAGSALLSVRTHWPIPDRTWLRFGFVNCWVRAIPEKARKYALLGLLYCAMSPKFPHPLG